MAHMPTMAALEFSDPMPFLILMEANDRASRRRGISFQMKRLGYIS